MKRVKISQRAVGQGGLCVGEFDIGGEPIRWIYDCGSNQTDSLLREINRLGGVPIDLLFLSHLDNDHINGVDLLLSTCFVKEAILPYLTEGERLLVIGEAQSQGKLTANFRSFIANPVLWLQGRGISRVTLIRGGGEDGREEPALPREPSSDIQGRLKTGWNGSTKPIRSGWATGGIIAEPGAAVIIEDQAGCFVTDWFFLPQVHRPSSTRARAFGKAIAAKFPGKDRASIIEAALHLAGRISLREAYDTLWADHNKITMSLYAGPHPGTSVWKRHVRWPAASGEPQALWYPPWHRPSSSGAGWLSAGDADLSASKRRTQFLKFYQEILPRVSVFVVPHHGSAGSFDHSLLDRMPAFLIGVAAAGPNGYGHPHQDVRDAVTSVGSFAQVNEQEPSTLTITLEE